MFSPTGLCVHPIPEVYDDVCSQDSSDLGTSNSGEHSSTIRTIGQGYLVVRSRLRITQDGGHSMLAVQNDMLSTRLGPVSVQQIPVHQPVQSSASIIPPALHVSNTSLAESSDSNLSSKLLRTSQPSPKIISPSLRTTSVPITSTRLDDVSFHIDHLRVSETNVLIAYI
jgi:hypothetical protein